MAFCKNCGKEIKKGEKCSCETEVKFCKACGKKLVGDEVCDCKESKTASTSTGSFDFVETMKSIKDDLVSSIKKPVSVIEESTDKKDMPKTYINLVLIALTFGIFIASLCKTLFKSIIASSLGGMASLLSSSDVMDTIKIPYIKIILFSGIIMAILIAAYAVVMLLVSAIFKNEKLGFKETLTLSTTAYAPLMAINLICAILGFIGVNTTLVLIVYMIASMIISYNFIYGYAKYTKLDANKFGYAIALLLILSSLIMGVCTYAVSNSMAKSISKDIVDIDEDDLEDLEDLLDY